MLGLITVTDPTWRGALVRFHRRYFTAVTVPLLYLIAWMSFISAVVYAFR